MSSIFFIQHQLKNSSKFSSCGRETAFPLILDGDKTYYRQEYKLKGYKNIYIYLNKLLLLVIWINCTWPIIYIGKRIICRRTWIHATSNEIKIATITLHWFHHKWSLNNFGYYSFHWVIDQNIDHLHTGTGSSPLLKKVFQKFIVPNLSETILSIMSRNSDPLNNIGKFLTIYVREV